MSLQRVWQLLLLLLLTSGREAAFQCQNWPDTPKFGCKDDGQDWKQLGNSASTREACKSLCEAESAKGSVACCFYSRPLGCNIKIGAVVSQDASDNAYATVCSFRRWDWLKLPGTLLAIFVILFGYLWQQVQETKAENKDAIQKVVQEAKAEKEDAIQKVVQEAKAEKEDAVQKVTGAVADKIYQIKARIVYLPINQLKGVDSAKASERLKKEKGPKDTEEGAYGEDKQEEEKKDGEEWTAVDTNQIWRAHKGNHEDCSLGLFYRYEPHKKSRTGDEYLPWDAEVPGRILKSNPEWLEVLLPSREHLQNQQSYRLSPKTVEKLLSWDPTGLGNRMLPSLVLSIGNSVWSRLMGSAWHSPGALADLMEKDLLEKKPEDIPSVSINDAAGEECVFLQSEAVDHLRKLEAKAREERGLFSEVLLAAAVLQ